MCASPRSYMTDRQGLTWQQTFFKRVISLSSVRWFFSLLSEQWWGERSADGVVTDLRVMQVRGHRVAGLLLEEDFSGHWVVEIVEEAGLITCERGVIGQRARLLIGRSAQVILLRGHPHGRGKGRKSRFRKKKWKIEKDTEESKVKIEERTDNHSGAWHMDGMTRTNTWANVVSHIIIPARCERENGDVWGCTVYTHRRLQQIAVSCKRTYHNNFFKKKNELFLMSSTSFLIQWHHEELEEEGRHLWYCWKGIGSARSSPDSRWRRFIIVTAIIVRYQCFLISQMFLMGQGGRSGPFCANLSISMHFSSVQPTFELRVTKNWISKETIVNSFINLFWYISSARLWA